LGKAIGFNALRNGALREIHVKSTIQTPQEFFESMKINNKDHEFVYGDRTKSDKMGGND